MDHKERRKRLRTFYKSSEWRTARELALKRDDYLCVMCQKEGKFIPAEVVHHKIHLNESNVDYPEIALNQDNLISLCAEHHFLVHSGEHAKGRMAHKDDEPYNYTFDENGMLVPLS